MKSYVAERLMNEGLGSRRGGGMLDKANESAALSISCSWLGSTVQVEQIIRDPQILRSPLAVLCLSGS